MVYANLETASRSVADAFRERDITTLATTGALASLGFVVATTVGSGLSRTLGLDINSRLSMAALTVGAVLAAMGQLRFFGDAIGGAMSIGALVAVGTGAILTVVGPSMDRGGYFRGAVSEADMSENLPTPDGVTKALPSTASCSACGGGTTHPQPSNNRQRAGPRPHGGYR